MNRIAIIGLTGSGKTTLGDQLQSKCHIPHIDLDTLYWGPNWTPTPPDEFRMNVATALQGQHWVTSGNYSKARQIIWSRADSIIWLDYSLPFILRQLVPRTVHRIITHQDLGHGNRETWCDQFFSRESLLLWAIQRHKRYRREFPQQLFLPEYPHLNLIHFHRAHETARWLEALNCETT